MTISRRTLLKGIGAAPAAVSLFSIPRYAHAAEITLRYGNNLPLSHPLNIRAKEAADRIAKETNGRVEMLIFPANQLGGDTDMLSQVRNGALTFFTPSALVIATLVPVAAINAVGFAFNDYDQVWAAMDGALGAHVRDAIANVRLHALREDVGQRLPPDDDERQADRESPGRWTGLKIRVPVSPLSISMFKALGAAPASLQFSEVYTALQTKVVDAQENPLPIIQVAKLYEVQKYCALTTTSGTATGSSPTAAHWAGMPADVQEIVSRRHQRGRPEAARRHQDAQRTVQTDLQSKGLASTSAIPDSFRAKLRDAGFYKDWKQKFGPEAWGHLESVVGTLA